MNEQSALAPGWTISHFQVTDKLGQGGMGEVWKALDTTLGRHVALKTLSAEYLQSVERVRRFVQEAKSASALNHPNIVTIYEIGQGVPEPDGDEQPPSKDPIYYIAMEFISGETLREKIAEEEDPEVLVEIMAQVADGLAKAHDAGIIHRDLKPDNIMITEDGFAKVVDFGLAKLTERAEGQSQDLTQEGMVIGTVAYMSPEQIQGEHVDQRSDIFAYGCILYEVATGQRPFKSESTIDLMHKIVFSEPTPIAEVVPDAPQELFAIVDRCLAKDPEARYQSVKEARDDIRAAFGRGSGPILTRPSAAQMQTQVVGSGMRPSSGGYGSQSQPQAGYGSYVKPPSAQTASAADLLRDMDDWDDTKPKKKGFSVFGLILKVGLATAAIVATFLWWTYPDLAPLAVDDALQTATITDLRLRDAQMQASPDDEAEWIPLADLDESVPLSVVALEDASFLDRDPASVDGVWKGLMKFIDGQELKSELPIKTSPISRSIISDLYLGDDMGAIRGVQAFTFAYGLESRFNKDQILEMYLNIARFPGNTLGIDAAARRHLAKSAKELTREEAALLVASLVDPDASNPADPSSSLKQRAEALLEQIRAGEPEDEAAAEPKG